jgi:His/Glu/Gln/Arg/opine family amino acid ABC transporter permease subunit
VQYTFMWSVIRNNADFFYRALYNTGELALISILIALPFSIVCALLRKAGIRFISRAIAAYIMFIRATPLLVQVYFIFFGLPYIGITIPVFWCGVIALVLNSGAYLAEIVRGGLESIPKGHLEAARSLGLSNLQTIRCVILPQTLKKVLSPIIGQMTILVKDTSILASIGVYELTNTAKIVHARIFRPFEPFLVTLVLYVCINFVLMLLGKLSDRKLAAAGGEVSR